MTEILQEREALATLHALQVQGGMSEDEAAEGLVLGALLAEHAILQGLPLTRPAAWGILPFSEVSAGALRLPGDRFAGVVTRGLILFARALFDAVTAFVPDGSEAGTFDASWDAIQRELDRDSERHAHFVAAFRRGGEAPGVGLSTVSSVLVRYAELFALAAPFVVARIEPPLEGTLDGASDEPVARLPVPAAAQAVADVIALRLVVSIAASEGRDVALALAGVDLLLAGLGLLELLSSPPDARHDAARQGTARKRRATLREALAQHAAGDVVESLALADTLHRLFVALMTRNAAALEAPAT